jgi:polyisoprenoid-binding protein YceI
MRKYFYGVILLAVGFACTNTAGDKAEVSNAKQTAEASELAHTYVVDTENSIVTWVGSKPAGKHNGTINVSEGTLSVEHGGVTAGKFTMDMSTVTARDKAMDPDKNEQLTGHLRSEDFFNAKKYPTAAFVIVSVDDIAKHANEAALKLEGATHFVTGNLTMKDSTKAVKFPAIINVDDQGVTAKALFYIDRTEWGMHYKSDKSFGNQIINAKVEVGFDLVAK